MPYRDWLRLQEIDWPLERPGSADSLVADDNRGPRAVIPSGRITTAGLKPHRRYWTLFGAVALALLAAAGWMAWANLTRPVPQTQALIDSLLHSSLGDAASPLSDPARSRPPQAGPFPPNSESAPESVPQAPLPPDEPTRPHQAYGPDAPRPALMDFPQSPGIEHGPIMVRASRTHDFARAAPPEETHLCLKLTDPNQAASGVRAYALRSADSGSLADSLLPWGRDRRVHVRLRWEAPDSTRGRAGHWLLVGIADAEATLTAAP